MMTVTLQRGSGLVVQMDGLRSSDVKSFNFKVVKKWHLFLQTGA